MINIVIDLQDIFFLRYSHVRGVLQHMRPSSQLCRRKEAHPNLANVEVDKLRVFVCYVTPKISTHEAVPPMIETTETKTINKFMRGGVCVTSSRTANR